MSQYFPNTYEHSGGNMKLKLDLSSITARADLEGATGVDTSKLAAKSDLPNLKVQIDKLDGDKLKSVPADLSKLDTVINNDVVKKLYMINWFEEMTLLILKVLNTSG